MTKKESIVNWTGFTPKQIADHALETAQRSLEITVPVPDAATKAAVIAALKGRPGANCVEVLTLDEHAAKMDKLYRIISETAVNPGTTDFSNPEAEVVQQPRRSNRREPSPPVMEAAVSMSDVEPGERVRVSRRSKKMINPAYAPKKRGGQ